MADGFGLPPPPEITGSTVSALPSAVNSMPSWRPPNSLEGTSEYRELVDVITRTSPEAVRQVIRDYRHICLQGSDYHAFFLLNFSLTSANPVTTAAVERHVGEKMVRASKGQIFSNLSSKDVDELADVILAKASTDFLDKSMACRLETIPARRLLNALARAERLGYNISDVVEENTENVIPSAAAGTPTPKAHPPSLQAQAAASHQASGSPAQMNRNMAYPPATKSTSPHGIVHCTRCGRPCSGDQAFRQHAAKRACEHSDKVDRLNIDVCPHCGCHFTSSGGLAYHKMSKVCGDYNGATQQAVIAELLARPRPGGNLLLGSTTSTPPVVEAAPTQPAAMTPKNGTVTPGRPNGSTEDPYSKLTPEARRKFELEMLQAEEKYGTMMRQAMSYPEHEREDYLQRIKNSFNSKQSTTRKKYGIRLRERRTKAEIEEERTRLLNNSNSAPSAKRLRLDNGTPSASRHGTPLQAATGTFNVPSGGGLVEVAAQPELVDPTTTTTTTTTAEPRTFVPTGTSDDPMPIADDSSSSSTDDENDDIPARLPAQHFPA
ncbi:hypothetical protein CP533_5840 [Ophiocordyceps camponoti-saundersi (nom. inval.)]|nr:hypothetical protein CP533_5840 [Ophiocordyceps camponoti-saundersi (nom. inval.)]